MFETECYKQSRKEQYQELVVVSTLYMLKEQLGWSLEKICSQWNWAPCSGFLNNSKFSLTWQLTWKALPLSDWGFKTGLADLHDCTHYGSDVEEMVKHTFYYCKQVHQFWCHVGEWTAHISAKQERLLYVGYVINNVDRPWKSEKCRVFLAVAQMMIWTMQEKKLYEGASFSNHDLIHFFRQ